MAETKYGLGLQRLSAMPDQNVKPFGLVSSARPTHSAYADLFLSFSTAALPCECVLK